MGKFCKQCGHLMEGYANCPNCGAAAASVPPTDTDPAYENDAKSGSLLEGLKVKIGLSDENLQNANVFERNQKIVPDSISANEEEIPVRQYNLAILRSRIKGQRSEGRLQVTNKRLIFRATGVSFKGRISLQNEFALEEIAGVEIRKGQRISFLNILLSIFVSLILSGAATSISNAIYQSNDTIGTILAVIFGLACIVPFFVIKKLFWGKLCVLSLGIGALAGTSFVARDLFDMVENAFDVMSGSHDFSIASLLLVPLVLLWIFNVIIVSLVPDLRFLIKTKSSSDAVQIRRKDTGLFKQNKQEYTGFSEVLPWKDADKAMDELGALIDDIQNYGAVGVEKWKIN